MADDKKNFGDFLRELRSRKMESDATFSIRGLAGKIDVSPTYLSKIERGELPASDETIYKLADALGITAEELFAHCGKIEPKLEKDIASHEGPLEMAAFLRTASGLSRERLNMYRAMIDAAEAANKKKEGGNS